MLLKTILASFGAIAGAVLLLTSLPVLYRLVRLLIAGERATGTVTAVIPNPRFPHKRFGSFVVIEFLDRLGAKHTVRHSNAAGYVFERHVGSEFPILYLPKKPSIIILARKLHLWVGPILFLAVEVYLFKDAFTMFVLQR